MLYFILCTSGGGVVHSYGRLIFYERVITDKQQLQPLNNDSGDGRIECKVSSEEAGFSYRGLDVSQDTSQEVHQIRKKSFDATIVIRNEGFNNFGNLEGKCDILHHYLFLSNCEWYTKLNAIQYSLNTCYTLG